MDGIALLNAPLVAVNKPIAQKLGDFSERSFL
jgi:hypothetical protein